MKVKKFKSGCGRGVVEQEGNMTSLTKKSKFTNQRINKIPQGAIDGVNLSYTIPNDEEFWPDTLQVSIDGVPKDNGLDFIENGTTGFTFIIDEDDTDSNRMEHPVCDNEEIRVTYWKKPKCK